MDAYPAEYVVHNLPLVVLSGLNTTEEPEAPSPVQDVFPGRATTTIGSEIPPVTGERAQQLLQTLLSVADGSNVPWNGRGANGRSNIGFKIRTVGRDFKLPPKRADAPSSSGTSPPSSPTFAPSWTLHSPISPLTPASSIFPDGVMTPAWVAKHQTYVPSVFISVFAFSSDPSRNSLNDNQLKTEINKIKGQIQKSEHRTRYVVVLLSDKTVLEDPDIDERLANIRRATGLDPKNTLFLQPPNTSPAELRTFVITLVTAVQSLSTEYYRDLTKHARRKRARGAVPPPTALPTRGASHPLTHPGWNVRYDFKLGVFAEFRQEMETAQRHYNIALDGMFSSEGLFETTASWSPTWDDIRLLADVIAFRILRCQIGWVNVPTSATQFWTRYKIRLKDLLDRRGKGSSNYGWEAWESRWAQIMAQLIQRADLPIFQIQQPTSGADALVDAVHPIFCPPEKQIPIGERLPPWELLHHAGYWYKLSADHAKKRYILARDMPEEDRTPPGMSPATKVSNRNQIYDRYLVPEPHLEMPIEGTNGGFKHWQDIVLKLGESIIEYEVRGQLRKVEQLQLEISRTLLHVKHYDQGFKVLKPLWENMAWRREGWWSLASEVVWALHECALRVRDAETYVITEWELYSPDFTAKTRYRHDLMACLTSFPGNETEKGKRSININTKDIASCLSISFTFSEAEGNVGEPLPSQIVVTSTARQGSAPITLSDLTFRFKGCISEIRLSHEQDESRQESESILYDCTLEETAEEAHKSRWSGTSDLTIHSGQSKIYRFPVIFREAGEVAAVGGSFEINSDQFNLVCTDDALEAERKPTWWLESGSKVRSRLLHRDSGISVKVLPKPPKMEISFPDLRNQYYTNEPITVNIEVLNKEEEDTEAVLEVRLLGRSRDTLGFTWVGRDLASPMKEGPPPVDGSADDVDLPGHLVGRLAQGAKTNEKIQFTAPSEPADYALEVKVLYHLLSDRDIPISKTMITDLIFNAPFEASYDINPRVHPDDWPSYFKLDEVEDVGGTVAQGIAQKWALRAKIASFAAETLVVKDLDIDTHAIHGGATCDITKEFPVEDIPMKPEELIERSFNLDCRKLNLEERRATALDLSLSITWQRSGSPSNPIVVSSLVIPHINFPSSEPRVLASALRSASVPGLIHMDYYIENPTLHLLTFELNMEASEEFGFSGPKLRNLQVLPMSRQSVRYNLLPLVKGAWISPQLRVVDRYFNKSLKVIATEGLRTDKKGVGVWVHDEGEEEK